MDQSPAPSWRRTVFPHLTLVTDLPAIGPGVFGSQVGSIVSCLIHALFIGLALISYSCGVIWVYA